MAGQFLLIEVEDKATADLLIQLAEVKLNSVVVGQFMRPDDSCECPKDIDKDGKTTPPSLRVEKLGWWVCTKCMKPRPDYAWLRNQVAPNQIIRVHTFKTGLPRQPLEECGAYAYSLHMQPYRRHLFE